MLVEQKSHLCLHYSIEILWLGDISFAINGNIIIEIKHSYKYLPSSVVSVFHFINYVHFILPS